MATGYSLDCRGIGVGFPAENFFSSLQSVHTGSVAHPASYPVGTEENFPGVKQPGCEANDSLIRLHDVVLN
jgi:hypothetical protein